LERIIAGVLSTGDTQEKEQVSYYPQGPKNELHVSVGTAKSQHSQDVTGLHS